MATAKKSGMRATPKKKNVEVTADDLILEQGAFTWAEQIEIEEIIGCSMKEMFWPNGEPKAKLATAMLFVRLRRRQPDITFEEVANLPLSFEFKEVGEDRPTKAARKRTTKR